MKNEPLEVWLRGPLINIPQLLQPVAHALLQAREEVNDLMYDLPPHLLWVKLAGMASPGFHLQHMKGVLDRLLTYAKGESLSSKQLDHLQAEGADRTNSIGELLAAFNKQVDLALEQISKIDEKILTEARGVGRAQLPSTVIGLLTHSAEHTMRHLGQLLVTVNVLKAGSK